MKKSVAELRVGDQFYWGKSIAVVVGLTETRRWKSLGLVTYLLKLEVPSRRWEGELEVRSDQQVPMVEHPARANWSPRVQRRNPYFDQPVGYCDQRHESSYAADIDEPPKSPRKNISVDLPLSPKTREWYEGFHGTAPAHVDTRRTWFPGEMILIGEGVDIGYKIKDAKSAKEHRQPYVHEFGQNVKVYRRAKRGEHATRTWYNFPTELRVLGFNLGFSYADANGEVHEVKGSDKKYLAVTPSRKALVVVGPSGVEFVMEGGRLLTTDWIYN